MKLSNKAYDWCKWLSMIALDAVGLCYKMLAAIWGWPFGEQVYNTCVELSICVGALAGISSAEYYKGQKI